MVLSESRNASQTSVLGAVGLRHLQKLLSLPSEASMDDQNSSMVEVFGLYSCNLDRLKYDINGEDCQMLPS